jgi:hypothetical protein
MSALPPKADNEQTWRHVRFVPKADKRTAAKKPLFDHLVGAPCNVIGQVSPSFLVVRLMSVVTEIVGCRLATAA